MNVDLDKLERHGFVFQRGFHAEDLLVFSERIGPIRYDPRSPELIREILPQQVVDAKKNTLSSRYGTGSFPFHTDCAHWDRPAQYLLLFCVNPGEGRRQTLLQDSQSWTLATDEEELACRALWRTGHVRSRLCTVCERSVRGLTVRYDTDCMRPMTAEAREVALLLEANIEKSQQCEIDWEENCLLVVDNRRMVHARGKGELPDKSRVLKRILVGG